MRPHTQEAEVEVVSMNEIEIVDVETVCSVCDAEFLDAEDLKLHFTQTHLTDASGRRYCKFCSILFSSTEEFAYHFRDTHLSEVVFCQLCFRAYSGSKDLKQHVVKHCVVKGSPCVTCSQCSLVFKKSSELRNHEFTEHNDNDDGVLLNNAFALLSESLCMNIVDAIEAIRNKTSFCCKVCSFRTKRLNCLINHQNRQYCKTYVCDQCFAVYRAKTTLIKHVHSRRKCQHFTTTRLIKERCPSCKKSFAISAIQEHIGRCSAVKCTDCNIVFKSVSDLSEHRLKEHQISIALQICKLCSREFVGEMNLRKHIERVHKDISLYRYKCIYCGVLYVHPRKLFAHFFSRHKDIAPYSCKICNKYFKVRKNFTIHIKMVHNSNGFVEFDKNLHAFFAHEKSKQPFVPRTPEEILAYNAFKPIENKKLEDNNDVQEFIVESEAKQADESTVKSDVSLENEPNDKTFSDITQACETEEDSTRNIEKNTPKSESLKKIEEATKDKEQEESPEEIDNATNTNDAGEETCATDVVVDITQEVDGIADNHSHLESIKQTETEAEQPEAENKPLKTRKRRARTNILRLKNTKPPKDSDVVILSDEHSEDEPLIKVKEAILKGKNPQVGSINKKKLKNNKHNLTCNLCRKYCYTYQNYYHHMSLHEGGKLKKCIKCHEVFRSKDALHSHIEQAHSSSQLTDTLKTMLQKRKGIQQTPKQISMYEKFRRTIKKVDSNDNAVATIAPIQGNDLSVKNFIENFKPEGADVTVSISNSVTIKTLPSSFNREPTIKLNKFTEETVQNRGLCMPVKFKEDHGPTYKVSVKLVHKLITKPPAIHFTTIADDTQSIQEPADFDGLESGENNDNVLKNDAIPEVAQEIMLEGTEEAPKAKPFTHQIVLPNLPEQYADVRIGHLHPEAPFYKIVKVNNILSHPKQEKTAETVVGLKNNIQLSDGTKLVSVNPFAHLLQDEQLQKVLQANKNRYYRPRRRNIENAIAKAMAPNQYRKKKMVISGASIK